MAEQRWLQEVLASSKSRMDVQNSTSTALTSTSGHGSGNNNSNIPTSVRNAPPEMRAAIRRKQNSEVSSAQMKN